MTSSPPRAQGLAIPHGPFARASPFRRASSRWRPATGPRAFVLHTVPRAICYGGNALREDAVSEVKAMLDEHATGWGLKREEDVVLTWKGHKVVFATTWMPA